MFRTIAQLGSGFGALAQEPATPTFTLTAGDNSVVAAISGDAGATHFLKYKASGDSVWQSGGSRSGDGAITVSSLDCYVPYIFTVYSQIDSSPYSLPAAAQIVTLAPASAENDFDSELTDQAQFFLDAFGEAGDYLPAGGGSRSIKIIVDREGAAAMPAGGYGNSPLTHITVANSSTIGISSAEINTDNDKIKFALREGDALQSRIITKIISQDAGMLTLEVR